MARYSFRFLKRGTYNLVAALLNIENCFWDSLYGRQETKKIYCIVLYWFNLILTYTEIVACKEVYFMRVSRKLRNTCEQIKFNFSSLRWRRNGIIYRWLRDKGDKRQRAALGIVITGLRHKREAEINWRFLPIYYPSYPQLDLYIVKWANI